MDPDLRPDLLTHELYQFPNQPPDTLSPSPVLDSREGSNPYFGGVCSLKIELESSQAWWQIAMVSARRRLRQDNHLSLAD